MIKPIAAALFFLAFHYALSAQEIVFKPKFGNEALKLDKYYKISSGDSLQITTFRFYISNVRFLKNGKTVWTEPNSHHLVDMENPGSLRIACKVPVSYNQIGFDLGIDSLTNVSGAMSGDLDTALGMYWTRQSVYINFKLEGNSNLCPTRNHEFQFHLGGYLPPNNTLQRITMSIPATKKITVAVNLNKWYGFMDLPGLNQVMSPCQDAVFLSDAAIKLFKIEN